MLRPEQRAALRILLVDAFASADMRAEVCALHDEVDGLVLEVANTKFNSIPRFDYVPEHHACDCASTERASSARELAPRSGALEPEETTDGPHRKG